MTATLIRETEKRYEWFSRTNESCDTDLPYGWSRHESFDFPRPKNFDVPFSSVLNRAKQLSLFVEIDRDVLGGTPRMDNTRIPVYMVLSAIEEHGSIEGATQAYRLLTAEQVRDALKFAVNVLESPLEHQSSVVD